MIEINIIRACNIIQIKKRLHSKPRKPLADSSRECAIIKSNSLTVLR